MSTELKPAACPFCAGNNGDDEQGETYRWRRWRCGDCGAIGPEVRCNSVKEARQLAIAEWNRRAATQEPSTLRAELVQRGVLGDGTPWMGTMQECLADTREAASVEAAERRRLAEQLAALRAEVEGLRADAARYIGLRDWLIKRGLLDSQFCQPAAGLPAGDYWILRGAAIVDGKPTGFGKTTDAAIDSALASPDKPA